MRKGDRMVILRFDGRVARLQDDGAFWVRFGEGGKSCSILLLGHPQISRNQPQLPMRYK